LVEIAADENRAVIFSTHIVSDVERVANQVWMLREGVLAYQGGMDELKESFARVTLVANQPFAQKINWPHLIKQKNNGNQTLLTFERWLPEMEQQLAQEFSAQVQVEFLGLEDIFLELNQ
jgi:ABC-2 type transport system ATP-binding protein